ncbi:MAG: hypothetical protein K0S08_1339 [Gammaproteobacteria bacterium]|jgi:hypothetical protein|nr:hypothetical protein [Gammaproteobacteria bacterium]
MKMMKKVCCVLAAIVLTGPLAVAATYNITPENVLGSVLSGNKQLSKAATQWEIAQEDGIEARLMGGKYLQVATLAQAEDKLRAEGFAASPSPARLRAWKGFYGDVAFPQKAASILVYGISYGPSENSILGVVSAVFPAANRVNNGFVVENNGQKSLKPLYKVNAERLLRDYKLGKFKEIANFGSRVSFTIRGYVYTMDDAKLPAVLERLPKKARFLLTLTDTPDLPVPTALRAAAAR